MRIGDVVYLVVYALTNGIEECRVTRYDDEYVDIAERPYRHYRIGKDIFIDRAEAIKIAHARRIVRINDLRKQIKRLETLVF